MKIFDMFKKLIMGTSNPLVKIVSFFQTTHYSDLHTAKLKILGANIGTNFKGDPLYRYQKQKVPASQSYLFNTASASQPLVEYCSTHL